MRAAVFRAVYKFLPMAMQHTSRQDERLRQSWLSSASVED